MTTIEQQKKDTVAKLEALERVSLDHKALLVSIESVDVVELITAHIKAQVTKLENYAKKHGIEFKVDTNALVAKVKLPIEQKAIASVAPEYKHGLPFDILIGTELTDKYYNNHQWNGTDWVENWDNSWESSQNC